MPSPLQATVVLKMALRRAVENINWINPSRWKSDYNCKALIQLNLTDGKKGTNLCQLCHQPIKKKCNKATDIDMIYINTYMSKSQIHSSVNYHKLNASV